MCGSAYKDVFLCGDEKDVESRRAKLPRLLQPRPETQTLGLYSEATKSEHKYG